MFKKISKQSVFILLVSICLIQGSYPIFSFSREQFRKVGILINVTWLVLNCWSSYLFFFVKLTPQ